MPPSTEPGDRVLLRRRTSRSSPQPDLAIEAMTSAGTRSLVRGCLHVRHDELAARLAA